MNIKAKTGILLGVSLIVGLLLGLLISPFLQKKYIERRIDNFRKPDRFIEKMINIIEPDESQKEKIREILEIHHERMTGFHDQIKMDRDSLIKDLEKILTSEQMEKLDKMLKKGKPHHRHNRKHRRR